MHLKILLPTLVISSIFAAAHMPASERTVQKASRGSTGSSQMEVLSSMAPALKPEVLRQALHAAEAAGRSHSGVKRDILAIIDYSLPSTEPRLWIFDTAKEKLLFEELVSHGKNSGGNQTIRFSNVPESLMSSLGTFVTGETYVGRNGYSLRLHGLERGFNDKALERAIVMHGADYVSAEFVRRHGRLGRSWGCPAVRRAVARPIIDTLAGGAVLFSYFPQAEWLSASGFLDRPATLAD